MSEPASTVFFTGELEAVATFWRIYRRDGTALGFTAHDRDLWFDGLRHRAAPGMVAGAIRRSAGFADDGADVEGMLAHSGIEAGDLRAGRYDDARIELGAVDWETLAHVVLYSGTIAALSFELFADDGEIALDELAGPAIANHAPAPPCDGLLGISHEGGSLADFLAPVVAVYPAALDAAGDGLRLLPAGAAGPDTPLLGTPVAVDGEDAFGRRDGIGPLRTTAVQSSAGAIRYYDVDRDYQPGVQRRSGAEASTVSATLAFPATLAADTARQLIESRGARERSRREAMRWRIAELDPAIGPGRVVRLLNFAGDWLVEEWEWRDTGIELSLVRLAPSIAQVPAGDSGIAPMPPDLVAAPSLLRAIELPWDGTGAPSGRQVFAALASPVPEWAGAALFAQRQGQLEWIGTGGRVQSCFGRLASALAPSTGLLFEPEASVEIETATAAMAFATTDTYGLAAGRNRLMIGAELVQFHTAQQIGERLWHLSGLLRGRGGTEPAAIAGHATGRPATLVDDSLVALGEALALDAPDASIAAIGRGDGEPVFAAIENPGLGTRPLMPVHASVAALPDGDLALRWTRRSRGSWLWSDGFETPLNEDFERYRVGIGPVAEPLVEWVVDKAGLTIPAAFVALYAGQPAWVCQIGRSQMSEALFVTVL